MKLPGSCVGSWTRMRCARTTLSCITSSVTTERPVDFYGVVSIYKQHLCRREIVEKFIVINCASWLVSRLTRRLKMIPLERHDDSSTGITSTLSTKSLQTALPIPSGPSPNNWADIGGFLLPSSADQFQMERMRILHLAKLSTWERRIGIAVDRCSSQSEEDIHFARCVCSVILQPVQNTRSETRGSKLPSWDMLPLWFRRHVVTLITSRRTGLKRMMTKVLWLCCTREIGKKENLSPMGITIDWGNLGRKVIRSWDKIRLMFNLLMHGNWVVYFRTWSRRSLFCGRAPICQDQSNVWSSQRLLHVILKFDTKIPRSVTFVQVNLISVAPTHQNLRIVQAKRQSGKS